ncbi:MAG: LamG-like jellyroll fold domain-containing protein [bacterium]|nr:LamG-like jellyroll fold domain-containing protein [bacterium]
MPMKENKQQFGFTLLELLVVISIIGLLASTFIFGYSGWTDKARLANTKAFSQGVRSSVGFNVVGQWMFDDGTARDVSGFSNNGIINGAIPVAGAMGNALSFNGSSDYIRIPATSIYKVNSMTISAWVKTSSGSTQTIMQQGNNCNVHPTPWFYFSGGAMIMRSAISDTTYYISSGAVLINDNKFHFLVVSSVHGQAPKFYFDGKDVTASSAKWYLSSSGTNWDVLIGAAVTGPCGATIPNTQFINGLLDDVAIYKEVLTIAQIQQLYVGGLTKRGLALKE